MVKVNVEVETSTPVELIGILQKLLCDNDVYGWYVVNSVGWVDDPPGYWSASLEYCVPPEHLQDPSFSHAGGADNAT